MIITISGLPGSGKTTVGKLLAKKLGFRFYSIGDLRGKMATDRGLTIERLNEIGMKEDWTDKEADEYQKELDEKENNFVIESRLGFHFIPKSLKVFLEVDIKTATQRIFKHQRPDEERKETPEELEESMKRRIENDKTRYKKYYGIEDFMDRSHYDHVVDTTNLTIDRVVGKIIEIVKKLPNKDKT